MALTAQQEEKLRRWLAPSTKLRIFYGDNHPGNRIIEIRGMIDGRIIHREWVRRGKYWQYMIDPPYRFEMWMEDGRLQKRN